MSGKIPCSVTPGRNPWRTQEYTLGLEDILTFDKDAGLSYFFTNQSLTKAAGASGIRNTRGSGNISTVFTANIACKH